MNSNSVYKSVYNLVLSFSNSLSYTYTFPFTPLDLNPKEGKVKNGVAAVVRLQDNYVFSLKLS